MSNTTDAIAAAAAVFGSSTNAQGNGTSKSNITQAQNTNNVTQQKTGSNTKNINVGKNVTKNTQTNNQHQSTTGSSTNIGTDTSVGTTSAVNTADAAAIKQARNISSQALSDSMNPNKTNALVDSVLGKAAIAFAPTGNQGVANGLYGSSTINLLQGFAKGQATADAAGAVLNYQTTEQGIAQGANADVLNATKTTTTANSGTNTSNQQSFTSQLSDLVSKLNNNTINNTVNKDVSHTGTQSKTGTLGRTATNTKNNSSSTENQNQDNPGLLERLTGSIICTELNVQGKLDYELYRIGMRHFLKEYSNFSREAYIIWARPVVRHLQEKPNSLFSAVVTKTFRARAAYIAHKMQPNKYAYSFLGQLATGLVSSICRVVGYGYLGPKGILLELSNKERI